MKYKVQLYTDVNLNYGDLIEIDKAVLLEPNKTLTTYGYNSDFYYKTNDIKFKTNSFTYLKHIPNLSSLIYKRIDNINDSRINALLKKQIFNISNSDLLNDFISESGLNYYGYYLMLNNIFGFFCNEKIKKRLVYLSFFVLLIINPCFQIINFILFRLLSEILKNNHKTIGISSIIILTIFPYKALSISFIFPTILRIFLLTNNNKQDILALIILMNSYIFKEVDFIRVIFYRPLIIFEALFSLLNLLALVLFPPLTKISKLYFMLTDNLFKYSFKVSGKAGLITLILYILLSKAIKKFPFKNIIIVTSLIYLNVNNPFLTISYVNVLHGDAILLIAPFWQETILIDTGSSGNYYMLNNYLKGMGVKKIDYLLITHSDEDHSGNLNNLINDYKICNIVTNKDDVNGKYFKLLELNKNSFDDVNANSNCYYTKINELSYLFTGDIDLKSEKAISEDYDNLDVDILKVAHHGSKTSSSKEFIKQISPLISIISCSNKYGFPSSFTLDTLNNNHSLILSTKENGDIKIICLKFLNILITSDHKIYLMQDRSILNDIR